PLSPQRQLFTPLTLSDQPGERWYLAFGRLHAWLPDGSGILTTVQPSSGAKHRVARWDAAAGTAATIYTPPAPATDVADLPIGPAGDVLLPLLDHPSKDVALWSVVRLEPGSWAAAPLLPPSPTRAFVCF